jgi:hypothetical protein
MELFTLSGIALKNRQQIFNLNSSVGSDEEPQNLDGDRHEDFDGHILW